MYIFEDTGANYRYDYMHMADYINASARLNKDRRIIDLIRTYAPIDLFFLLYFVLNRTDINDSWIVDRCNEVQDKHNMTIDIWARYTYKSTFNTIGITLQTILNNPEESNVIFSHTRGIAKKFLRQLKLIMESNKLLILAFPDIFFDDPKTQSPKWSEDDGLLVKRKYTKNEMTLEAWGLVDGMPTSAHYDNIVYNDIVTEKSVYTPDQLEKTEYCFGLSDALKSRDAVRRIEGTFYHFNDLYHKIIEDGLYELRFYPAEVGDGVSLTYLTDEELSEARINMGRDAYATQMMLDPVAGDRKTFEFEWIKYYKELPAKLNIYILVDPADEKKKKSDFTSMAVIGLDCFKNYYLLDLVRDKLNLLERWLALRNLVQKWETTIAVGYEKYGKDSDIAYMQEKQIDEGVHFSIISLGGNVPKIERIKTLQAPFQAGKFLFPMAIPYTDINGKSHNLIDVLINEEFLKIPFAVHDDIMDSIARIRDPKMNVIFPRGTGMKKVVNTLEGFNPLKPKVYKRLGWMSI